MFFSKRVLAKYNKYCSQQIWVMLDIPGFNVLIATGVLWFHNPSHTSPNWPEPNFFNSFRDFRSISQWSTVLYDKSKGVGISFWGRKKRNNTNTTYFVSGLCVNLCCTHSKWSFNYKEWIFTWSMLDEEYISECIALL